MAEPTPANIFRVSGKLIASPTGYDADPANNHGGVVLGAVTSFALDIGLRHEPAFFDELGKAGEFITFHDEPLIQFALRSRDDDALQRIFTTHAASVTTLGADPVKLSAVASLALLFAPDNPDAPGVYLVNAVPMASTQEVGLRFSVLREQNLYVVFAGLPASASSPVTARMGKVQDILV